MVVVMALVGIAIMAAIGAIVLWLVGSKVFNMEGVNYGNSFLSVFAAGVVGWLINWLLLSAGITFLIAPFGYSMVGMLVWGILWGTVILTPCCKQFWGCEMFLIRKEIFELIQRHFNFIKGHDHNFLKCKLYRHSNELPTNRQ